MVKNKDKTNDLFKAKNEDPVQYWDAYAEKEAKYEEEMQKDEEMRKQQKKKPIPREPNHELLKTFNSITNMDDCLHILLQNHIYKQEYMEWDNTPEFIKWYPEREDRLERYYREKQDLVKSWHTFILKKIQDTKLITRLDKNEGEWRQFVDKWYGENEELLPDASMARLKRQLTNCANKLEQTIIHPHKVFEYKDTQGLWQAIRKLVGSLWIYHDYESEEDEEYDEDDKHEEFAHFEGAKTSNPYLLNFLF